MQIFKKKTNLLLIIMLLALFSVYPHNTVITKNNQVVNDSNEQLKTEKAGGSFVKSQRKRLHNFENKNFDSSYFLIAKKNLRERNEIEQKNVLRFKREKENRKNKNQKNQRAFDNFVRNFE